MASSPPAIASFSTYSIRSTTPTRSILDQLVEAYLVKRLRALGYERAEGRVQADFQLTYSFRQQPLVRASRASRSPFVDLNAHNDALQSPFRDLHWDTVYSQDRTQKWVQVIVSSQEGPLWRGDGQAQIKTEAAHNGVAVLVTRLTDHWPRRFNPNDVNLN